jgi:hypothetical protein
MVVGAPELPGYCAHQATDLGALLRVDQQMNVI